MKVIQTTDQERKAIATLPHQIVMTMQVKTAPLCATPMRILKTQWRTAGHRMYQKRNSLLRIPPHHQSCISRIHPPMMLSSKMTTTSSDKKSSLRRTVDPLAQPNLRSPPVEEPWGAPVHSNMAWCSSTMCAAPDQLQH